MRNAAIICAAVFVHGCGDDRNCVRDHVEKVWLQPPPVYMLVGKTWIPFPQAGYFMDVTVCDEYEERKKESQK